MLDHERARELAAMPADQLAHGDLDWLNRHLAGCPECRAVIRLVDAPAGADTSPMAASPAYEPRATRPATLGPRQAWAQPRVRLGAAVVATLTVALVGGLFAWNRPPADDRTAEVPTSSAEHGHGSATPSASIPPAPVSYRPTGGVASAPTAELAATHETGGVVALDSEFRLTSRSAEAASSLAGRITVEPALALTAHPEAGDRAARLVPVGALQPGVVYRFTLHGDGDAVVDTWAFQARQPLRIINTLPGNRTSDVPLDTGIEVTFDQDGLTEAGAHFSIDPPTRGRFEQHGRTLSFVPERPLTPTTVYSVVVSAGVRIPASGEATRGDTRFQFETAAKDGAQGPTRRFSFPDAVAESSTEGLPTIGVWVYSDERAPTRAHADVYRLAGLPAAIEAFRTIRARPDWTNWSTTGVVDTSRLPRVVSGDLSLREYEGTDLMTLPRQLPAGWYLVAVGGKSSSAQTVLQITDVAGYVGVSTTRAVVWVNDLASHRPIGGAVATSEGIALGTTGSDGLITAATPASLLPAPDRACDRPCDPVVVVRTSDGRGVFLPTTMAHDKAESFSDADDGYGADPSWWSVLDTDRQLYRRTDTVNVWGMARNRATGRVPDEVTVRMTAADESPSSAVPDIATLVRAPGPTGSFAGSISLADVPEGYYSITTYIGDIPIRSASVIVGQIAKPAYTLDVRTGHHVYVDGDRVATTIDARFFEGTPVPGVPLRIAGMGEGDATTDGDGTATWRTTARFDRESDRSGPMTVELDVSPARPEEGEITGTIARFVVFPSSRTIDSRGAFSGGRVIAAGSLHRVDLDGLERGLAAGRSIWELDQRGAPVANGTVTVRFYERIWTRRVDGTTYDFLEKRVVPNYVDELHERLAGTVRVRTSSSGTWRASVAARGRNDYRIDVSSIDADGHLARSGALAGRAIDRPETAQYADFGQTHPSNDGSDPGLGIGDRIDLTFRDPKATDDSRYLFITAQGGIRSVEVRSSARYVSRFPAWGVPNLSVGAIAFNGRGYTGAFWQQIAFRSADRRLQVALTTDASRYRPGQTVTIGVRTRDANGSPVRAAVVLRSVDEKLFAMGAATLTDPRDQLYSPVPMGMVGSYVSHGPPSGSGYGEGGDTTGGGDDRTLFRDSLLFQTITTDSKGRGSVSFKLSDDLTSWRVTAAALTTGLQAGTGDVLVPVGLPFFADATIASEYLASDRPSIAVRTYGTAVDKTSPVLLRVTSTSLGFDSGPIATTAFRTATVPLPALRPGRHDLRITATSGSESAAKQDRLTRTFDVVETRLSQLRTHVVELPSTESFQAGTGFTTVVISDGGGARYLGLIEDLASADSGRVDRALAADVARSLLRSRFGITSNIADDASFVATSYQHGGLAVVPYGSPDLELSALAAIAAPDRLNALELARYLQGIRDAAGETRERQLIALVGMAGLGQPVLPAIRDAAAGTNLTTRERLLIGLGAAALGDSATARSTLDAVLRSAGEQAGEIARVRVGTTTADIAEATALAAWLAADLGEPLAAPLRSYVDANRSSEVADALPAIGFALAILRHESTEGGRFAWTVGGVRRVVELAPGGSFTLNLTPAQVAELRIDRLAGHLFATSSWREPVAATAFRPDPDVQITRNVRAGTRIASGDVVVVHLVVTLGPQASAGCHEVTDLVPAGLAPIGRQRGWPDDEQNPGESLVLPSRQTATSVTFCVERTPTNGTWTLEYVARVVTPGRYNWEPAIAQSITNGAQATLTDASWIEIG
jgi:hypothetical protein